MSRIAFLAEEWRSSMRWAKRGGGQHLFGRPTRALWKLARTPSASLAETAIKARILLERGDGHRELARSIAEDVIRLAGHP